ncbi:MAG: lamin tail domain-containing protein [Candidatus Nitrosopelagicus sp.]|nr:lamin tail domain-containing protein [Candidatus Nitrosopelagicus sp.]
MNRLTLSLLFVILIAGVTSPAYAQSITNHVVINEVDTNPAGDDSKFISEWVELYNPTNLDVDLSDWEIASTTVLKKTFTIPDGTIISSGDFLTFVYEKVWFTDTAESVELKNQNGILIDKTREVFDLENDSTSWQRIYDGFSDWKFESATAGGSNGKLVESIESASVIVTVSSDQTSYYFDDTVIVQGTVSEKIFVEKPTFQTAPIKVQISGPNFYHTVSLYPDYDLNYQTTLDLVQVLGVNEGTYDVIVNYGGVTSETSFSVGFEVVEQSQQISTSFNVSSEKSEYFPGELVTINGFSSDVIPFESIQFTITDSNNQLIDSGNLFTSTGDFETSIFLTTVAPNYGVYQITAEYGDQVASNTFTVSEVLEVQSEIDISEPIIFNLDQSEYLPNEVMRLSGSITNFDSDTGIYYQVVSFNFRASDGTVPTFSSAIMDKSSGSQEIEYSLSAIPDTSGLFSVDARIPAVVFTDGDYTVKANYGGLIATEQFSIVSEKSSTIVKPENSGNPNVSIPGKPSSTNETFDNVLGRFVPTIQTVIEKVNRISDSLISITTQEKTINEQSVKPRVLSGSMLTVSKDAQSSVNLLVSSESGICIIGEYSECLVKESTRKPGQIFEVVQVDGLTLNVRYSGPDVRLEKFSISPQSSGDFLPDSNWNIQILKDNEVSRFYYKVTYKTLP